MEVIVTKNIGLCFGYSRALAKISEAENALAYALGPNFNLKVVEDLDLLPKGAKIFTHVYGENKEVVAKLKSKYELVDITCPKVAKIQALINERKRNLVVIVGFKDDLETKNAESFAKDYITLESEFDLNANLDTLKLAKKISIFSVTTFDSATFMLLVNKIKRNVKVPVEVIPSLCPILSEKIKEALNIAKLVDLVIIVGNHNRIQHF